MAHPIEFEGANTVLGAPVGAENVEAMHVFRNGICCVSCWVLSPEEMAEVAYTGRIFITVLAGKTQPPIFAGGEKETRELIADYGVWKR
jgi:hypothetical protein